MEDIAPSLQKRIMEEFIESFGSSKRITELYKKIDAGIANYADANEFAIETGEVLAGVLKKNLSSDILPDGKLYYNIADRVIRPMLENNYELVADVSSKIQEILNKELGIGIKAIKPKMNEDKVQGIIDIVSGKENYDDIAYMLDEPIVNFTQSVVNDAVRENADFQYRAGLSPKIRRTSTGKCCEWCDKLAGIYDYADVSNTGNDVFRRHKHCRCLVEYDPGGGKRQNVHTKSWSKNAGNGTIEQRKTVGLQLNDDLVNKNIKEEISNQNITKIAKMQEIHRRDTSLYKYIANILESKGQYGPSYIIIPDDEILELAKKYSGTGIVKYNRKGQWNHQEVIVTNYKIIGVVVDNRNGNSAETSVFKIHYANDGIHIVPDYPSKKR